MVVNPGDGVKFVDSVRDRGRVIPAGTMGIVVWYGTHPKPEGVIAALGFGSVHVTGLPFAVTWTPKREKARP